MKRAHPEELWVDDALLRLRAGGTASMASRSCTLTAATALPTNWTLHGAADALQAKLKRPKPTRPPIFMPMLASRQPGPQSPGLGTPLSLTPVRLVAPALAEAIASRSSELFPEAMTALNRPPILQESFCRKVLDAAFAVTRAASLQPALSHYITGTPSTPTALASGIICHHEGQAQPLFGQPPSSGPIILPPLRTVTISVEPQTPPATPTLPPPPPPLPQPELSSGELTVGTGKPKPAKLQPECQHGRPKSRCKDCGGRGICEHGKRKYRCRDCGGSSICQHGKQRYQCKDCGGGSICEHGKQKHCCRDCGGSRICVHGRQKHRCRECGGSAICEHSRLKHRCKDCGGSSICEHGRRRHDCKECRGKGICEHGRQKQHCKDCGGSPICEHGRQKNQCKPCGGAHGPKRARAEPDSSGQSSDGIVGKVEESTDASERSSSEGPRN